MQFVRLSWGLVAFFALVAIATSDAKASDYGPHADVAAIRRDVTVLLNGVFELGLDVVPDGGTNAVGVVDSVDDVVLDGDVAVATWRGAAGHGLVTMRRTSNRWWLTGQAGWTTKPYGHWVFARNLPLVDGGGPLVGPTTGQLQEMLHVTPRLANLAEQHIAEVRDATLRWKAWPDDKPKEGAPFPPFEPPYPDTVPIQAYSQWLEASLDAEPPVDGLRRLLALRLSAPTESDLEGAGNRSIYGVLSMYLRSGQTLRLPGLWLKVWFPFVLPDRVHYTLHMRGVEPEFSVKGTLRENTLVFDLPAFALPLGATARGEISGNRY